MGARDGQKYTERAEREGDRAPVRPEVAGHAADPAPPVAAVVPDLDAEGAEVEGHAGHRRSPAIPEETAAGEAGEGGPEVEGHFSGTHPYILQKAGEGRREDMLAEADRDRRANEARSGQGGGLLDRLRGRGQERG